MKLVILESPFAGNHDKNIEYARLALRHSLEQGEAPLASHLLYTQPGILDDENLEERNWGITAGLAWITKADYTVVYQDLGISTGMKYGMMAAKKAGNRIIYRNIL